MSKSIRQTVYFLLITLVINAGGWTFNKDAVADILFDEQQNMSVENEYLSDGYEYLETASPEIPCNHWCHSIGHFVGLHTEILLVTPVFTSEYSRQQSLFIQFSSPDGLYRPPRLLS